jgi:hypothetical protein
VESSPDARLTAARVKEVAQDFLSLVDGEIDAKAPVGSVARRLENVWRFVRGVLSRLADGTDTAQPIDGPEALIDEEREALDATVAWVDRMRSDCACLVEPLAGHVAFPVELEAQVTEFLLAVRDAADRRGALPTAVQMRQLRNRLMALAAARREPDRRQAGNAAAAGAAKAVAPVTHAPDFSFLSCPRGKFSFDTTKSRQIIEQLYLSWARGGDGCGLTEAAIAVAMKGPSPLRLMRAFDKCTGIERILERRGRDVWALWLHSDPPPPAAERESRPAPAKKATRKPPHRHA